VAYSAISSVVLYATQKPSASMSVFLILWTGFIGYILNKLLTAKFMVNMFWDLNYFTINPIIDRLISNLTLENIVFYVIYVLDFVVLSIFAFYKKELEF
jgi:hypothetical protein